MKKKSGLDVIKVTLISKVKKWKKLEKLIKSKIWSIKKIFYGAACISLDSAVHFTHMGKISCWLDTPVKKLKLFLDFANFSQKYT